MRIAYVGNRKNLASDGQSFNTENHVAQSLEHLGHDVTFIQEDEVQFATLPDRVKGHDLFLWTRTWADKVLEADLKTIEAMGIPTVSFHLDKYTGIARDGGMSVGSTFWKTQFVFSPEGSLQAQRIFKEHGVNQYYLPAGVFGPEVYRAETRPEYAHDVVFVGGGKAYAHSEWSYRGELVTRLENMYGDRFMKYGYPEKTVRGQELNTLYSSSKIIIGDSLCKDFMDSYYWSDRIYETIGRGGFMIHPYIPGITDHFIDRQEAVFYSYGNWQQLRNLIDYYLTHDEEREAIRSAGLKRVEREHTYRHRMEEMLHVLRAHGVVK